MALTDTRRTTEVKHIPLFPLSTVLFPGGNLPLRIFEPRYLRMVGDCMKRQSPFGVCLLKSGREAGEPGTPCPIGTLATIKDWYQMKDGMLGLLCVGRERFSLIDTEVEPDRLIVANVRLLIAEPANPVAPRHQALLSLAKRLMAGDDDSSSAVRSIEQAAQLSHFLAHILPLKLQFKQQLLECDDPNTRLDLIKETL